MKRTIAELLKNIAPPPSLPLTRRESTDPMCTAQACGHEEADGGTTGAQEADDQEAEILSCRYGKGMPQHDASAFFFNFSQ